MRLFFGIAALIFASLPFAAAGADQIVCDDNNPWASPLLPKERIEMNLNGPKVVFVAQIQSHSGEKREAPSVLIDGNRVNGVAFPFARCAVRYEKDERSVLLVYRCPEFVSGDLAYRGLEGRLQIDRQKRQGSFEWVNQYPRADERMTYQLENCRDKP